MKWLSPWIHTTGKCNCACPYCFVKKVQVDMESNTYDDINRYFLSNINRFDYIKYRMAGGEPLLVIKKWIDFAFQFMDGIGDKGGIEILSNFTIYPNELDVLIEHRGYCNLNVSLDSITMSKPFVTGVSSAETVIKNIVEYQKRHSGKDMFIMTVITENGKHLPAMAEYICEAGFKWEIQANKEYDPELNWREVNANMKIVVETFGRYRRSLNSLLYNFCDMKTDRCCENGSSLFAIMPDGGITNCQMQSKKICSISDDVISMLEGNCSIIRNANSECSKCIIYEYCHGDCPLKSGDARRMEYICKTMKFYVYHALKEETNA